MANPLHYAYRVTWSAEDDGFVASVAELPSLSWIDASASGALEGLQRLVGDVIADMQTTGEAPPEAIADRSYSGRFVVRVPPELHRQLAVEAAEQQVSLNRLAASRLASA